MDPVTIADIVAGPAEAAPGRTFSDLLTEAERRRQATRSAEHHEPRLTASSVDTVCERRDAFRLNRVPKSDPERWGANTIGTMIHEGYARFWADAYPSAVVERRSEHGRADVIIPDEHECRDLKTLNQARFSAWTVHGAPDATWQQLAIYVHDYIDDYGDDSAQWTMVLDLLCRETNETRSLVRPYRPEIAEAAFRTLDDRTARLRGADPYGIGTGERRGHGDVICGSCPWFTVCVDDDTRPVAVPLDEHGAAFTAARYVAAAQAEKQANAEKRAAMAELYGFATEPGRYRAGRFSITRTHVDEQHVEAHTKNGYDRLTVRAPKEAP